MGQSGIKLAYDFLNVNFELSCDVNFELLFIILNFLDVTCQWRNSVGRGTGLVIERLQNLDSTHNAAAHRCVFGKDT